MASKKKKKSSKAVSLLDDDSLQFIEDDGDTTGDADICASCGMTRARHTPEYEECPGGYGNFKENA